MPEFPVVPPHEAGKQIRVLATQLYEVLQYPPNAGHSTFVVTMEVENAWARVREAQIQMDVAINTRKLTLMRPAALEYREAARQWRNILHLSASQQVKTKKTTYPPTAMGTPVADAMKQLRDLANNLPTNPDLPSTDSRDTALRAIIAVLRTHEIPGSEGLTHEAKEDKSAKTAESVGDKATGPGSGIFASATSED